jgi:hypothetical protein
LTPTACSAAFQIADDSGVEIKALFPYELEINFGFLARPPGVTLPGLDIAGLYLAHPVGGCCQFKRDTTLSLEANPNAN